MATFVRVLRSRRFWRQRRWTPTVTLSFAITGSGGLLIGGTGIVSTSSVGTPAISGGSGMVYGGSQGGRKIHPPRRQTVKRR